MIHEVLKKAEYRVSLLKTEIKAALIIISVWQPLILF